MNLHPRLATGLIAALLMLGTSHATAHSNETTTYGSIDRLDLTLLLPAPPTLDSPEQKAEVEAILAAQKAAGAERIAQAVKDAKGTVFDMFGQVLGAHFTAAELPATARLFARLGNSEAAVVEAAQNVFDRKRPFAADGRVQVLPQASMMSVEMAKSQGENLPTKGSWPSSRAARVTASAIVMSEIVPERKSELWSRAREYAESRVIAGMHYPQDLEMGYRAGTALAALLQADAEFKAEFAAARQETRTALGLK